MSSTTVVYTDWSTVLASVCAILFCVVGVIGNSVTILALIRCRKLRSHATTAFVLSLSISDLIFCAVNLPLTATRYINKEWTFGDTMCQIFPLIFYGNVTLSVLNMVAITINRYVLIAFTPYYNTLYSRRSIYIQLLFIWVVPFLILLPPLLGVWGEMGLDEETFSCTILEKHGKSPKTMIFVVGFGLPSIVIIICYSCIYWKVRKSRKNLEAHNIHPIKDQRTKRKERDDRRLTKLALTIFICFLFCFLPLMVVNVFDTDTTHPNVHVLASILAWMSSVINPLIYAVSNHQYREAYAKLFNIIKSNVNFSESLASENNKSLRASNKKLNAAVGERIYVPC